MIAVKHYQIGDIKIKISSDFVLPTSKDTIYKKFLTPSMDADARYSICKLKQKSYA